MLLSYDLKKITYVRYMYDICTSLTLSVLATPVSLDNELAQGCPVDNS
jgi:hypothetical protein